MVTITTPDDLRYIANITIGGACTSLLIFLLYFLPACTECLLHLAFPVELDTGSADLWVQGNVPNKTVSVSSTFTTVHTEEGFLTL